MKTGAGYVSAMLLSKLSTVGFVGFFIAPFPTLTDPFQYLKEGK
mgnify:CR=1